MSTWGFRDCTEIAQSREGTIIQWVLLINLTGRVDTLENATYIAWLGNEDLVNKSQFAFEIGMFTEIIKQGCRLAEEAITRISVLSENTLFKEKNPNRLFLPFFFLFNFFTLK